MKGFVPVTKDSLLEMVANCRQEVNSQEKEELRNRIDRYIKDEKERMTTRRWYRLFILPKARFAFDDESVTEYSANREYAMFDGCPLHSIKQDAKNSRRWLDRFKGMADSDYSGEPILLDINTFDRLAYPEKRYWATIGICYTLSYS